MIGYNIVKFSSWGLIVLVSSKVTFRKFMH